MLAAIAGKLTKAQKITLIVHQNPDGDAIGSASALFEALTSGGKTVELVCATPVPALFERVVGRLHWEKTLATQASDVYILLDCSDVGRSGFSRQLQRLVATGHTIISLDHHGQAADSTSSKTVKEASKLSKYRLVDARAVATTELIFRLLGELHMTITPSIATAILLGLYTDTGAFTHANTTSRTLQLASRLIYYGANLNSINQVFCRQLPKDRQRLWGQILAEVEINRFGVVVAKVTQAHFRQTRTEPEAVLGLANFLALAEEAKAALVWIETTEGYRGVLRTRHATINLGRLARLLGGTGQKKAAGFTATKALFSGKIE